MALFRPCRASGRTFASSWTKTEKVEFILGRTGVSPLDVEIDTGMDMFKMVGANAFKRHAGLKLAATEAKRWRNLTVTSFLSQLDRRTLETRETGICIQWTGGRVAVVQEQEHLRR